MKSASLIKHLRYARYLMRHRWYVFVELARMGLPVLGLIHDLSKFRWSEWKPYADFFYGERTDAVDSAFTQAWLLHQNRNKHHWQYWMLVLDSGETRSLPMPDKYRREMLADWIGAGRAITGIRGWRVWYQTNKRHITLHPETQTWIDAEELR